MRVGRTTVIDRIVTKNGYGDVLPFSGVDAITIFYFSKSEYIVPVAGYGA